VQLLRPPVAFTKLLPEEVLGAGFKVAAVSEVL